MTAKDGFVEIYAPDTEIEYHCGPTSSLREFLALIIALLAIVL